MEDIDKDAYKLQDSLRFLHGCYFFTNPLVITNYNDIFSENMNTFINPLLTMVHGQISWVSFWSMAKCACAPAGLPLGGPMQCSGAPAACAAARGGRTAGGWTAESRGGLAAAWARCRRPEQRNRGGAARASAAPAYARRPRAPG